MTDTQPGVSLVTVGVTILGGGRAVVLSVLGVRVAIDCEIGNLLVTSITMGTPMDADHLSC
ncbi:MAG: hypothetical protein WD766_04755 [Gemmatimonadota bacterium]